MNKYLSKENGLENEIVFWENLARNLSKPQKLFIKLVSFKKCIWCSRKFPEGIIEKRPKTFRTFKAGDWFKGGYLFHTQSTHGFTPESITMMLAML